MRYLRITCQGDNRELRLGILFPPGSALNEKFLRFSFPLENSIDILGINMGDKLSIDNYIFITCKQINNQFNVMLRFRKLISRDNLLRIV